MLTPQLWPLNDGLVTGCFNPFSSLWSMCPIIFPGSFTTVWQTDKVKFTCEAASPVQVVASSAGGICEQTENLSLRHKSNFALTVNIVGLCVRRTWNEGNSLIKWNIYLRSLGLLRGRRSSSRLQRGNHMWTHSHLQTPRHDGEDDDDFNDNYDDPDEDEDDKMNSNDNRKDDDDDESG